MHYGNPAMPDTTKRADYIDNLRTMVIMLVVMLHLAVTYSSLGKWYYNEEISHDFLGQVFFATFQMFTQAFSMGLMFLLAGYFTPASLDRKGFGRFVADRFKRLGLPALIYLLVITPFVCWIMVPRPEFIRGATTFGEFYKNYVFSGGYQLLGMGPMWFAVALLGFSVIYGLFRAVKPGNIASDPGKKSVTYTMLAGLVIMVAAGAFLLRLVFPIGSITWGMQLCYFSQYVIMFTAGIIAYRGRYMERINPAMGRACLAVGFIAGTFGLIALKIAAGMYDLSAFKLVLNPPRGIFAGGITWQSISFALLESFIAVAMSAGLITLFREKVNFSNDLTKRLSNSSFAVYMFHPPIIIGITLLMQAIAFAPVAKWAMASIIAVQVCFFLGYRVLLKVPVLNKIL
jgi:glucans biosynthesis protein C